MCDFEYNDIIIVDNKINYMHKMLTYNTTLQSQSGSWKYNIKGGLFVVCIIVDLAKVTFSVFFYRLYAVNTVC
jgi:hypothetical protein